MRKESICISERELMFVVAGQLFDQAPNRQPRNPEIIMTKVRDAFRKVAHNDNEYYTLVIEKDELNKFIKELSFSIKEFTDLNLSQIEYEKNISVDDESRPRYSITSRYDVHNSESWKSDFIDLDAFVRNVINKFYILKDSDMDCFCCIHQETDKCTACFVNPKLKINYEGSRKPKGKYTFACTYNCYRSRYICCDECDDKDSCTKKCDSNSKNCGLVINKLKGELK
jgi:hypothetical protein